MRHRPLWGMPHLLTLASDCIKKKDMPNGGAEPLLRDTQEFGRLLQAMVDDLLHRKPDSRSSLHVQYKQRGPDRQAEVHAPAGVVHP